MLGLSVVSSYQSFSYLKRSSRGILGGWCAISVNIRGGTAILGIGIAANICGPTLR